MITRPRRAAACGTALVLLFGLASCGSSGSEAGSGSSTTDGTTTTAATDASTTEATAATTTTEVSGDGTTSMPEAPEGTDTETTQLDELPDGVHYGYMAGKEDGKVEGTDVQVIVFDKVDFFTGDEAVAAAKEDGVIPEDQDSIDNDYYIRNQNQTVRRLAVVPEATVTSLAGGSPDPVPSSVDQVWNQPYLFKIDVGNVRGVTTVSSIEAVFLP